MGGMVHLTSFALLAAIISLSQLFFSLKVMKTHPRVLFCYLNKIGMQKISLSHSLLFKLTQL